MPRRRRTNHGKPGTQNAIRRAQRIAIHGGDRRRRLREARQHRPRQDATGRFGERNGLGSSGCQRDQDARAGFLNRQQAALLSH